MRSLPPPRLTRKRRWKRFKRSIRALFTHGTLFDSDIPPVKSSTISKVKQGTFTSRLRGVPNTKSDHMLRSSANAGINTARVLGKLITKSLPTLSPFPSKLNVGVHY